MSATGYEDCGPPDTFILTAREIEALKGLAVLRDRLARDLELDPTSLAGRHGRMTEINLGVVRNAGDTRGWERWAGTLELDFRAPSVDPIEEIKGWSWSGERINDQSRAWVGLEFVLKSAQGYDAELFVTAYWNANDAWWRLQADCVNFECSSEAEIDDAWPTVSEGMKEMLGVVS